MWQSHGNQVYNPYKLRTHQRRTTRTSEKNPERKKNKKINQKQKERKDQDWSGWLQNDFRPPCATQAARDLGRARLKPREPQAMRDPGSASPRPHW